MVRTGGDVSLRGRDSIGQWEAVNINTTAPVPVNVGNPTAGSKHGSYGPRRLMLE